MRDGIHGFFGEYRFLSNFHLAPIVYNGILYPSNEHAYQAQKTLDIGVRKKIAELSEPRQAKRAGRDINLRPYWEEVKVRVMVDITVLKFFGYEELADRLRATGDCYLEETNTWGDRFWGVCEGTGENMLGIILMGVRELI